MHRVSALALPCHVRDLYKGRWPLGRAVCPRRASRSGPAGKFHSTESIAAASASSPGRLIVNHHRSRYLAAFPRGLSPLRGSPLTRCHGPARLERALYLYLIIPLDPWIASKLLQFTQIVSAPGAGMYKLYILPASQGRIRVVRSASHHGPGGPVLGHPGGRDRRLPPLGWP